jgi:hypothetical protein
MDDTGDFDIDVSGNVKRYVRRVLFRVEKDRLRGVAPYPSPRAHRLLQMRGGSRRPSDYLAGLRRAGRTLRDNSVGSRSGR